MKDKKIGYKQLSISIKTAIIAAWIMGVFWFITFLIGFIQEMLLW
uniref:Uncharacterized protein n=1 Tax=viral metagenome TaxID=1070528 RepID=A0A6H2A498_9ZZZZ